LASYSWGVPCSLRFQRGPLQEFLLQHTLDSLRRATTSSDTSGICCVLSSLLYAVWIEARPVVNLAKFSFLEPIALHVHASRLACVRRQQFIPEMNPKVPKLRPGMDIILVAVPAERLHIGTQISVLAKRICSSAFSTSARVSRISGCEAVAVVTPFSSERASFLRLYRDRIKIQDSCQRQSHQIIHFNLRSSTESPSLGVLLLRLNSCARLSIDSCSRELPNFTCSIRSLSRSCEALIRASVAPRCA